MKCAGDVTLRERWLGRRLGGGYAEGLQAGLQSTVDRVCTGHAPVNTITCSVVATTHRSVEDRQMCGSYDR